MVSTHIYACVCSFTCTHAAHDHMQVFSNAAFHRIVFLSVQRSVLSMPSHLDFPARLHVTLVAFAIWHSFPPQSNLIYSIVHSKRHTTQHEMDAGRRLRRCRLHHKRCWIDSLSHTDEATIICALFFTQSASTRFSSVVPLTNLSLLET